MAAKLICSITEFVLVDGVAVDKRADFFGGHYLEDDIPGGGSCYSIVDGSTVDQIGILRSGSEATKTFSTKSALVHHMLERNSDMW